MPLLKPDVEARLAAYSPEALTQVLRQAGVAVRGARHREALAGRVADALWWNATSPATYLLNRTTFESIVDDALRRLAQPRLQADEDPFQRLQALVATLLERHAEATLDALPPEARRRLRSGWWSTAAAGTGVGGSLLSGKVARLALSGLDSPLGRLLPLVPPLTPYVLGLRRVAGAAAVVSGPAAWAFGALTLNQALGPEPARVVALLLGIGALGEPEAVDVQPA